MTWESIEWQPATSPALAAGAPIAPLAPGLTLALNDALSSAIVGSATLTSLEAAVPDDGASLEASMVPIATFELLGAARRGIWAASEPDTVMLAGVPLPVLDLTQMLLQAADSELATVLGEGINLAGTNTIPAFPSSVLLVRIGLTAADSEPVSVILATDAAVPQELGAHVMALQVLKDAPAPEAAAPAPEPAAAAAPEPAAAARPAPKPAVAPEPTPAEPAVSIRPASFDELAPHAPMPVAEPRQNIDLLLGVNLEVSVEIGRTHLPIRDILALAPGSIIELDKLAGEAVDVMVNGRIIASGEVVVVDENFGVRITSIVSRARRISSAGNAA